MNRPNPKRTILSSAAFLAVFLFSGCDSNNASSLQNNLKAQSASVMQQNEEQQNILKQGKDTILLTQPEKEIQKTNFYDLTRVVDGDTVDVDLDGKTERIRLIGIDTPETVDPRKLVQCFGKEASDKAKEILTGHKVRLESDDTQGDRDKYNRLLRYVYLEDGTFFNKFMISEGYAHEYTYQSNPYKYQEEFKEAERQARENRKGLWGNLCNGNTNQAAVTQSNNQAIIPIVPTTPVSKSSGGFVCNCSKTCPQMGCAEAQFQLNSCGCSRRDADKDGVACDSQCQ